jgi:hypothetical protein
MDSNSKQAVFHVHVSLDQPAVYLIKIQGRLDDPLADWFLGDARHTVEWPDPGSHNAGDAATSADVATSIVGTVADQAALHGLLNHIRDLGLTLLYVDCLTARLSGQQADGR